MRKTLLILFCGLVGAVTAMLAGDAGYTMLYGASPQDPYRALATILLFGVPGLLWGLLAGGIGALTGPLPGSRRPIWIGLLVTLCGVLLVAGGATTAEHIKQQGLAPREARLDGRKLVLEFEVRLPPGREFPAGGAGWEFTFEAGAGPDAFPMVLPLDMRDAATRVEQGRVIVSGQVPLASTTWNNLKVIISNRVETLHLRDNGTPAEAERQWSAWRPDIVRAYLPEDSTFQIRYRLQFAPG
jgi:hypothetical protein